MLFFFHQVCCFLFSLFIKFSASGKHTLEKCLSSTFYNIHISSREPVRIFHISVSIHSLSLGQCNPALPKLVHMKLYMSVYKLLDLMHMYSQMDKKLKSALHMKTYITQITCHYAKYILQKNWGEMSLGQNEYHILIDKSIVFLLSCLSMLPIVQYVARC